MAEAEQLLAIKGGAEILLYDTEARTVPSSERVTQQLVDPQATRRHNDPMDLVGLARQVQTADQFVRATTGGKLQVILDQIRYLQQQAKKILEDAKRDAQLHHAACNFNKVPGHVYHLYERDDATTYFSMLSPKEWNNSCPHKFLGSYHLEHDWSWTPSERVEERSRDIDTITRIIGSSTAMIDRR